MIEPNKKPDVGAPGLGSESEQPQYSAKPPLKWKRVLAAFVAGESLQRFEAERRLHDHCLHTTVSRLESKGVRIERRDETVPGYCGIPTHVKRYWIAPESLERARDLLCAPDAHPTAQERATGRLDASWPASLYDGGGHAEA